MNSERRSQPEAERKSAWPRDEPGGSVGLCAMATWMVELLAKAPIDADDPAGMVEELRALETLKSAMCARQAELAVAFDLAQRAEQEAAGVPAARQGKGVAEQIALARRESPTTGSRLLGLAKALHAELPHARRLLREGRISEWRATIVTAETACLEPDLRRAVDAEIASRLDAMSDREVRAAARSVAYRLDPYSVVARGRHAESHRHVSLRPAPDTMTYLSAYLPVREGVACYAALRSAFDTARAAGDERSQGQVMADTLTTRLTGLEKPQAVPVEVQLIMTDRSLLSAGSQEVIHNHAAAPDTAHAARFADALPVVSAADFAALYAACAENAEAARVEDQPESMGEGPGDDDPAYVVGYGPVPAPTARAWIRDGEGDAFLRRLTADPLTGQVTQVESRRRFFPAALRRLIVARDRYCRTPWCGAPIRHADHVKPRSKGGPTNHNNGQGTCQRCNQTKEALGWTATTVPDPHGLDRHVVETITPTGHRYRSVAPAVIPPHPLHPMRVDSITMPRGADTGPHNTDLPEAG